MKLEEFRAVQAQAKALGISSHQKSGETLQEEIAAKQASQAPHTAVLGAVIDTRKQEAKDARMEGRARRGGAILGKGEMKLNRPEYERAGYHRRWFRDEGGRLDGAYANDYDYVEKNDGSKTTIRSGTNADGSIRTLYLMEKRLDWHKEDQWKKREGDRKSDKLLRAGKYAGGKHGGAAAAAAAGVAMYDPTGGIKIT